MIFICQKLPYCARRIDPCIKDFVEMLNFIHQYRTLLSCCGHSKYKKSIVVFDRLSHNVFEYYSGIILSHGIRKRKRYYKKDDQGYYYIPELTSKK